MVMTNTLRVAALFALSLFFAPAASAENLHIVFPPDSGVYNVVTDGGLDNTGKADVTKPLQELMKTGGAKIIYFPKGTYLVSDSLRMKLDTSRSPRSHSHGPWIVGESRKETVIRLKDGTWPDVLYDLEAGGKEAKKLYEQVVLSTGDATNTTFTKRIRNLTVHTGKDNAGAIGVMYNTSNIGTLGNVDIISGDGKGVAGLALAGVENGPGQVRDVRIGGFEIGVYNTAHYVMACSEIEIVGASRIGLLNHGNTAGLQFDIRMEGTGSAVVNGESSVLTLVNSRITGSSPDKAAITGGGMLSLREIRTSGFKEAMEGAKGDDIAEYHFGEAVGLFHKTGKSLALPVRKAPVIPYETDFSKWTSPMDFGAVGDAKTDDSDAVQKALNAPGKTHIVFPEKYKFLVSKPLTVGPDVVRIVGTHGRLRFEVDTGAGLTLGEGKSPVVIIEGFSTFVPIHVKTNRTVVIDSVQVVANRPPGKGNPPKYYPVGFHLDGGGEVFIDNTGSSIEMDNPACRAWVRHYNSELGQESRNEIVPVHVEAGTLWMLGWKSENLMRRVIIEKGGVMEMIGFNNWEVGRSKKDGNWPIFDVIDGQLSVSSLVQRGSQSNVNIVWETRDGEKRVLDTSNNPGKKHFGLYSGYVPEIAEKLRVPDAGNR